MYQCLYVKTLNGKKYHEFKIKKWGLVHGSVLWGEMEGKHTIVLYSQNKINTFKIIFSDSFRISYIVF